ncbi:MAG: FHA domain-containing protein [Synechococcus sp.]
MQPSLILVINDCAGRRALLLTEQRYTLGRAADCSIRLFDRHASRQHARLYRVGISGLAPQYLALDGFSASRPSQNGLKLNGQATRSRLLKIGDVLHFGSQTNALLLSTDDVTADELDKWMAAFAAVQSVDRRNDTIVAHLP